MKIPTKEQLLYAQLAIAHSIVDYIGANLPGTIFSGEDLEKLTREMSRGFLIMRDLLCLAFEKSEEQDVSSQTQ